MEEGGQDKRVLDLFSKDSHHRNITVLYLTQDLFPPGKFSKTINRNAHYIVAFKKPRDQTGIRPILLQAFPDRWRQVLRLFKRVTTRPFGYLMLDVHPASDTRYRLWSHLTPREGHAQVHTLPVDVPTVPKSAAMRTRTSTPAKKRWTHTDLSARMDTPTLSPAGVGSPPPPPLDTRLTDLLTELTRPVGPDQLNQEIEDFNISYPVDVDDALNLFSLPPVAGVGTAPATTITQPVTTSTQTRPVTSTRTRPVTATTTVPTTTSRPRPFTSAWTRPVTTATTTVLASTTTVPARRSAGPGKFTTTSTVTTPSTRPRVAGKQPRRRPAVPSSPSPDSSPPPSNEDGDDEDDDRRRGLRRRLDLLNEDAQQRSRGRSI